MELTENQRMDIEAGLANIINSFDQGIDNSYYFLLWETEKLLTKYEKSGGMVKLKIQKELGPKMITLGLYLMVINDYYTAINTLAPLCNKILDTKVKEIKESIFKWQESLNRLDQRYEKAAEEKVLTSVYWHCTFDKEEHDLLIKIQEKHEEIMKKYLDKQNDEDNF
jgi:hypothetical protein